MELRLQGFEVRGKCGHLSENAERCRALGGVLARQKNQLLSGCVSAFNIVVHSSSVCPEMKAGPLKTMPALPCATCFQLLEMNDELVAGGFKMGQRYVCPRMGTDTVSAMTFSEAVANKNQVIIFSLELLTEYRFVRNLEIYLSVVFSHSFLSHIF